jgi:hypothetical protein
MRMSKLSRPSPAMVVACVALSFALAGSAVAGTDALDKAVTKSKVKKIAKKQANKRINARESSLRVAHANTAGSATNATNAVNADTVDGKHAADLESKAFNVQAEVPSPLDPNTTTTILALDLPAGRYFVSGQFSINNNGAAAINNDSYTCAITGGSASHTVDGQGLAANATIGDRENYSLQLVATLDAAGQAVMNCTMPAGWTGNAIDPSLSAVSVQP